MKQLDESPLTRFHLRVCLYTVGGFFCDGYILGSIGLALPLLTSEMNLGPWWEGWLAASALIGIFAGALIFGPLTDKIGRQKLLLFDLILFVVASLAQLWVTEPVLLLVLRLLLGIAVGADYAIGPALLSEFVPRRFRGRLLSSMNATWTDGFVASYGVGIALQSSMGQDAWKWMLASSAVPAVITLLMRLGSPESPRWLMSKGRVDEAQKIVTKYYGPEYTAQELISDEPAQKANYAALFSRKYIGRTVFAGMFWFCQVFPYFGIGTFLPRIVESFGLGEGHMGEILFNVLLLAGAAAGMFLMDRIPRRAFLIWSFAIVGAALLYLGIQPNAPLVILVPVFLIVAFVLSAAADLETVYPAEIFPTEVRASGVGVASAISRAGAAISALLLPSILDDLGIGPTMLILAGVVGLGLVISIPLAPETRGISLDEAGRAKASPAELKV